jgi:hypothetical protein
MSEKKPKNPKKSHGEKPRLFSFFNQENSDKPKNNQGYQAPKKN